MIWYIISLSVIAVLAVAILLFFELMGDDAVRSYKMKHKRGEYVNDQTAVICHTIKDTEDSRKAYILFVEYMFTNHKQFLLFVRKKLQEIVSAFHDGDINAMHAVIREVKDMKVELKDQKITQDDCLRSIDPSEWIEASAWIHLANNCRFGVNEGIARLCQSGVEYVMNHRDVLPKNYDEQLEFLVGDIRNICNTAYNLIGTGDIEGMREARRRMSIILSESYSNTQRLYELLHDGRSKIEKQQREVLQYVLNNFQECHCMIYTLRRFLLCNICMTLSLK